MQNPVSTGISFAILIASVGAAFAYVSASQLASAPWFGFLGAPVTPGLVQAAGLQENHGILITYIWNGSAAEAAELRGGNEILDVSGTGICIGGDQIIKINGKDLQGLNQLRDFREHSKVGDTATLTILRDGKTMDVPVVLGERPQNQRELTDAELQEACK